MTFIAKFLAIQVYIGRDLHSASFFSVKSTLEHSIIDCQMTALGNPPDSVGDASESASKVVPGFGSGPRPGFITAVQVSYSSMWNLNSYGGTAVLFFQHSRIRGLSKARVFYTNHRPLLIHRIRSGRIAQKKLPATRRYGPWKPFVLIFVWSV